MKNSSITNAERFSFSANLGFLWRELRFLDRILQAKEHEFSAIEFHDEAQSCNLQDLQIVLNQTKLPVCSLNTRMGTTSGCAAIPEFATQAKEDVDHAIQTAKAIGVPWVLHSKTPERNSTSSGSFR